MTNGPLDAVIKEIANDSRKFVFIVGEGPYSRLMLALNSQIAGVVSEDAAYKALETEGLIEKPDIQKVGDYLKSRFKIKVDYDRLKEEFKRFGVH